MKKYALLIAISFFCNYFLFATHYEITGTCKLENQTKCDSISISLNRTIPSALNYIFSTDSIGNYSFTVEEGIYNIVYSKNGYIQEVFSEIQVYSNLTRDNIILGSIGLNGNINGVLTKGIYKVGASLSIPFGDTLTIEPDVTLQFEENAELIIQGLLIVQGTYNDSIIFTEYTKGKGWGGIKFNGGSDSTSILSYCLVERSKNSGISIINSSPTIQNSDIRYNSAIESDQDIIPAGIILNNSGSHLNNVLVYKNELIPNKPRSVFHGAAGIGCYKGNPTIQNSKIYDNLSEIWTGYSAGGLNCIGNCHLDISNSLIYGNSGHYGGGICCNSDGLTARNLTITQNEATMGGGIFISVSDPKIYNSIIANNFCNSYGRLLSFSGSLNSQPKPTFQNCLFSLKPDSPVGLPDFYSDVNLSQNIKYFLNLVTTNVNGVDCDPYYNILGFPLFVDSLADFKLNQHSPCIDAGNKDFVFGTYDLAGNERIANGHFLPQSYLDIGAYEFNGEETTQTSKPILFNKMQSESVQIVPNPVDNSFCLKLEGKQREIEFSLLSIDGKIMIHRQKAELNSQINISNLKSGMYMIVLTDNEKSITTKLIKR